MASQETGVTVGIDLGTSTSEVAYVDPATLRIRTVSFGGELFCPSAVRFDQEQKRIVVGREAYAVRVTKHEEVVLYIKREMGNAGYALIHFQPEDASSPRAYGPAEISGEILKYLRDVTQRAARFTLEQAVITVPAEFGTLDRQHTEKAAEIAGLEPLVLLPEPVAALVGHGKLGVSEESLAMVYDFGGGTFDCTIVRVMGNKYQVLAKAGDRSLGGAKVDELIAEQILKPRVQESGFDLDGDEDWVRRIRAKMLDEAERAKRALADGDRDSVPILLTNLEAPGKDRTNVQLELTQDQLASVMRVLITGTVGQMQIALDRVGLKKESLDLVLLVGGMTRLSLIKNAVRQFMGEEETPAGDTSVPRRVYCDTEPELVIAKGAALVAANYHLPERRIQLVDILLHTLGCQKPGSNEFVPLIPRNTDLSEARRTLNLRWGQQETVGLELFEGEASDCAENKYVGSVQVGPTPGLAPGTAVQLELFYRDDLAVPDVQARATETNQRLPATMVFEETAVLTSGLANIESRRELDLVICIDTTGSMRYQGYLDDFREQCESFVDRLEQGPLDWRLAFITFGDKHAGDPETVYSFSAQDYAVSERLGDLEETEGGDEPEASLDALATAGRLPFRSGEEVLRHIVIVTDAPPKPPAGMSLSQLVSQLSRQDLSVDVVGTFCAEFKTVTREAQGSLFDIDETGLQQCFEALGARVLAGEEALA